MSIVSTLNNYKNIAIAKNLCQDLDYQCKNVNLYYYTYYFSKTYENYQNYLCGICVEYLNNWVINGIAKFLKESDKNTICMFFICPGYDSSNNHIGNHVNLIIYRRNLNTLEQYDPNGYTDSNITSVNIRLKIQEIHKLLSKIIVELKFVPSWEVHGSKTINVNGVQQLSVRGKYGYCQIWCALLFELILKYENMSTTEILNYIDDKNFSGITMKRRLKQIALGFYYNVMNRVIKMENIASENNNLESLYTDTNIKKNMENISLYLGEDEFY